MISLNECRDKGCIFPYCWDYNPESRKCTFPEDGSITKITLAEYKKFGTLQEAPIPPVWFEDDVLQYLEGEI
jgi:hypothetical protein